jgi:hypothetical protein
MKEIRAFVPRWLSYQLLCGLALIILLRADTYQLFSAAALLCPQAHRRWKLLRQTNPLAGPTTTPSGSPSIVPTDVPTAYPTNSPTDGPSTSPSVSPTQRHTSGPSAAPSFIPTNAPNKSLSGQPSSSPTTEPSDRPSENPSAKPSADPTTGPSSGPSHTPSSKPSALPTIEPTSNQDKKRRRGPRRPTAGRERPDRPAESERPSGRLNRWKQPFVTTTIGERKMDQPSCCCFLTKSTVRYAAIQIQEQFSQGHHHYYHPL